MFSFLFVDAFHFLQFFLEFGVLLLDALAFSSPPEHPFLVVSCHQYGLVLLSDAFGVLGYGLAHEFIVFCSAGELLAFVEDLGIEFELFALVSKKEVLTGCLDDSLFAVEGLDALEASFMAFVVVLDLVQLHYAHCCFIIMIITIIRSFH